VTHVRQLRILTAVCKPVSNDIGQGSGLSSRSEHPKDDFVKRGRVKSVGGLSIPSARRGICQCLSTDAARRGETYLKTEGLYLCAVIIIPALEHHSVFDFYRRAGAKNCHIRPDTVFTQI
jgi:hypothetical protein